MDAPNIKEVIVGIQYCGGDKYAQYQPGGCDYEREVEPEEREMRIDEFFERIDKIEAALGITPCET
jgi:hypothetical protein